MSIERTPAQWVDELGSTALDVGSRFRIDPAGLMAVAALESGWGTSQIAQSLNNICGLNGYPEVWANSRVKELAAGVVDHDTEQWNGKKMTFSPGEPFLAFAPGKRANSLEVWAMWGRGAFFPGKNNLYATNTADATGRDNFRRFLAQVVSAGWCPTPKYVDQVMSCYDRIAPLLSAASTSTAKTPAAATSSATPASKPANADDAAALAKARQVMELIADDPTIPAEVVKATRAWRDQLKAKVEGGAR